MKLFPVKISERQTLQKSMTLAGNSARWPTTPVTAGFFIEFPALNVPAI